MNEDIKVIFIIPTNCRDENDCSEEMLLAFTTCSQHSDGGLQAQWVRENQWNKYQGLTRRDVIVLSNFEGELYKKLRATKCLIVGPRCLSCCLTEGAPIPSGPEPVYTVAMRGLVVTASGLTKQQKENVKKKVFWMGGIYSTVLSDATTHLVSNTVLSDKYIISVEKGLPVMRETWVDAVWDASLTMNINGSSPDFNSHRLPPFANLQVTTSGLSKKEKHLITKLVNENGGEFSGAFQSETTDVVILNKDGINGEKYKAAIEYGKVCVLPAWVKDSAAKGAALPVAKYKVTSAKTSSPLAEHRLPDMSLNFSRITNSRPPSTFVDETRSTDATTQADSSKSKMSQESRKSHEAAEDKDVQAAFESFDMSCVKKAGPIFDGFCVWVTGLEGICRERACAIVSRCGGVRYESPHERVTHVVCAYVCARACAASVRTAPVLSALWLLRSVQAGAVLPETDFLLLKEPTTPVKARARIEPASPLSKRSLQLLRHEPLRLPPPSPLEEPIKEQDELVNHYLSQNMPEEPKEKTPEPSTSKLELPPNEPNITEDNDEVTEDIEQIFRDIRIEVQGLDEDSICEIGAEISAAGGMLVAAGAGGTHVLVPLDFDTDEIITRDAEAITVFWIKDCLSQQELLPIKYYHRPVKVPVWDSTAGPLHGVVASLSTYSGVERAFLDELAKQLGATTQLRFCRRNTANALASTHLICPTPSGDKYLGAVKWGLPAVKAEWLTACLEAGERVSEREYLVGDSQAPPSPKSKQIEQSKEPTDKPTNKQKEKAQAVDTDDNVMPPPADACVPRRGSIPSAGQTPKMKSVLAEGDNEMSPASRYIAMARQGLLGCDSQDTPKRVNELKENARQEGEVRTPPLDDALSTPNLLSLSPTTRRRLQAVKRGEMPSDPIKTPVDPFDKNPETPDSAFGAALRPGSGHLSPTSRKRLWALVQDLPEKPPTVWENTTPLSEIRNRFLARFNNDAPTPPSDHTAAAPRKLNLQEQAETPPFKMAKLFQEHCAGSASKSDTSSNFSRNSISNAESSKSSNLIAEGSKSSNVLADGSNSNGEGNNSNGEGSNSNGEGSKSIHSEFLAQVDIQLERLNAALTGKVSSQRRKTRDSVTPVHEPESEPGPESQPNTVGWDDSTPARASQRHVATQPSVKRFMLSSNVDNREEIIEMIYQLGGEVCEGTEVDPEATHLLCAAPGRSEKMLGSIAAGRWVLHPAYIPRSRAATQFIDEEEYEWGNPKATCLPSLTGAEHILARAAHRWRARRARGERGPFAGVVALLHVPAPRRRLLARLVTAGDGLAPDDEPPYTNEEINVCFADIKRFPLSDRDSAWLISKRIPVCAPLLLSSYLTDDVTPKPEEHCLSDFRPT